MRIDAVMPQRVQAGILRKKESQPIGNIYVTKPDRFEPSFKMPHTILTFTGKNMDQGASFGHENFGNGTPEQYQGGLAMVTYEAPASMRKYENFDIRHFAPFHNHNNPKGGYKFLLTSEIPLVNGKLPEQIEARWFLSADYGQTREEFAKSIGRKPEELRFVIQSEPNGKEATSLSKYTLLDPTSAKGSFERMSNNKIGELEKVYCELFKISADNPSYNMLRDTPNYYIYTKELAKTPKPYSYGPEGIGSFTAEVVNSDMDRAKCILLPQMNTKEFGYFNPASYWLHDAPATPILSHIANESAAGNTYFDGLKVHVTSHNPGKYYQRTTDNPFEFLRVITSKADVETIRKRPDYGLLENFNTRGWNNLTEFEKKYVKEAFEPAIGKFVDFNGNYNMTKLALLSAQINPENMTFGTVSPNFDAEMKNPQMDVAPGLGDDLRKTKTISPLNGSTPASLGANENIKDFGRGANILSEHKSSFTPLPLYDGNNIDDIIAARRKNGKWFTNIIEKAKAEGNLNKVFFNDLQIEQGRFVLGGLSAMKENDILVIGWGRPDEQKGYPITFDGFLKFLKREDVPKELKLRVKLCIGAGDLPWDSNARDWKLIKKYMKEIEELEGGIYANNVMYTNGLFPKKLVACADAAIFTSRREICGITPLEAKSVGVPSIITATGGPMDYINDSNGYPGKTAPEMNPQFDKLTWETNADVIDDARIARTGDEASECFKKLAEDFDGKYDVYKSKCKQCIEDLGDWHNNGKYNLKGKSANKLYMEDIWEIPKGWEGRNKKPLKRLLGSLNEKVNHLKQVVKLHTDEIVTNSNEAINQAAENLKKSGGSKWAKACGYIALGVLAGAAGGGLYFHRRHQIKKAHNGINNNTLKKVG